MIPGQNLLKLLTALVRLCVVFTLLLFASFLVLYSGVFSSTLLSTSAGSSKREIVAYWQAPSMDEIPATEAGELIRYGRELIMHTSVYLGPQGSVKPISNGMNCTNCHLDGGTRTFGLNYAAVASTYPRWRERSGTMVDVPERVNECIERSLNGTRLSDTDKELVAMVAYLKWIGKDVVKGTRPEGNGMKAISFLDRPADPSLGKIVFEKHCVECHGTASEGQRHANGKEWIYPPVFGIHSYNMGAGLFRLSKFASFVKYNMPHGTTYDAPVLTDEEAWDVAAYVNTMPHPPKDISNDWPDISKKPVDHPFGPFADSWSERRHKYGPFVD